MQVRQVQVRGCLPTLIVLVVIGAALAALLTASAAFLAVAVAAGVVGAGVRWVRRLTGARKEETSAAQRAADVTLDAKIVEPPEGGGDRPPKQLE